MAWTIILAGLLTLPFINANAQTATVSLAWHASTSAKAAGYALYYGVSSDSYAWFMNVGTNLTATVAGLTPGVTYYFAATAYESNGAQSDFSSEVSIRPPVPPSITTEPMTQAAVAGQPVTLFVGATGDPPFNYQWFNLGSPIAGATNSSLSWPAFASMDAGYYWCSVTNAAGQASSSAATLTMMVPPSILTQPQSKSVIATTAASLSSSETGTAPLSFQWYFGTTALMGATNNALAWASVGASNAGSYYFTVSNAAGVVTSAVASLKVFPTNTISTVAGSYNGLFYQTNANGTPNMSEATAGFLGNCVVTSNGAYSAKIYLDGASCSLGGLFSIVGSASNTISLPGTGLSNLTVDLQLDLFNGSQQITGAIASTAAGNAWSAPLLGYLATNARPILSGASLLLSPGSSANSPTNSGSAIGLVVNGVLSLSGTLADTAPFAQNVPISTDGNVPLFVNLYTNGGLLAGWINLAGSAPSGNLTWIRPSGVLEPPGFPQGFDTVLEVGGAISCWSNLVTRQTLGTLNNSFTGPVGFQFVCASNCTCRALGRWVVPGNTHTHVVALCENSSAGVDACVTIATAGATPGAYAFANLATPYPMKAGTTYYILSMEESGGDQFYLNFNSSITCTSLAGSIPNASISFGSLPTGLTQIYLEGSSGESYGPVNMQYSIP